MDLSEGDTLIAGACCTFQCHQNAQPGADEGEKPIKRDIVVLKVACIRTSDLTNEKFQKLRAGPALRDKN